MPASSKSGDPPLSDKEFIELWRTHKSATAINEACGLAVRGILARRRRMEQRYGIRLAVEDEGSAQRYSHLQTAHHHPQRYDLGILNGTIIVFSDAHYWPGIRTTAHKGLLHLIRNMQPQAVVNNGDAFDGASISRFPAHWMGLDADTRTRN
jgi:hypothetical protein